LSDPQTEITRVDPERRKNQRVKTQWANEKEKRKTSWKKKEKKKEARPAKGNPPEGGKRKRGLVPYGRPERFVLGKENESRRPSYIREEG